MATKYSLNSIQKIGNRKVFFDANVLIYIFWPSGSYKHESDYSTAFNRLLRQKNELLVDFIVISEFINRAHRLEYEKHPFRRIQNYKEYRNSVDGQEALSDIYLIVETNILSKFTVVAKAFSRSDIQSFLTLEPLDFSDKGILMTCIENACILLTNDSDFKGASIDLLSSHKAILNYAQ